VIPVLLVRQDDFSRQVLISCFPDFMFNDKANQQLRRSARDQIKEYQNMHLYKECA
jgi:hypothetical protein